jgi:hypothetical protein
MGRWSSAVALQGEAANHRKLLRSRAVVVSVAEKARQRARQVWAKKASASDPLMTCRNRIDDIETGLGMAARDEPGGCLLIGQAVSGMEVARAWSGLWCGTWEPVAPRPRAASGVVLPAVVRGREIPKRLTREGLSTDAWHRGGPPRGSDEGSVMGLERRGRVILTRSGGQPRRRGRSR